MGNKKQRQIRATLLAVGEGDTEEAFLKYLRSTYCSGNVGVSVTVMNAHGKGPGNVVATAVGHLRMRAFDRTLTLMDTDLEWTKKDRDAARKHKIELIGSTPCIEGLLLRVLGKPVPDQSAQCKKAIAQLTKLDLTDPGAYSELISKVKLDAARLKMPELDQLLGLLEGTR
jgi:hypothetical protein